MFCLEISLPYPIEEAFAHFGKEKGSSILVSGGNLSDIAQYSFAAVRPFLTLTSYGNKITLTDRSGLEKHLVADPFDFIDKIVAAHKVIPPREVTIRGASPPFLCGAIGYFGYDLRTLIEKLPARVKDNLSLPDIYLAFYDTVLHYNISRTRAYIFASDFEEKSESARKVSERKKAEEFAEELLKSPVSENYPEEEKSTEELFSNFTRSEYVKSVEKIKRYIFAGDVYQVNMSQRFSTSITQNPYEIFQRLVKRNPEPFAAYINPGNFQVISTSPERFLKVVDRYVETRPIKGTRPRGKSLEEDASLMRELVTSEKDAAELSMIVDLERNDLGKVCEFGSVLVREHKRLEKHPTVFHLVSIVQGFLQKDVTIGRLLKATFPGGSITGAPKIRAMEIIDELEQSAREIYTGAIGYIGFDGTADLNIAIRTMVTKDRKSYFNVGGGIVADSDPEAEYEETLHKAKALAMSLGKRI